METTRTAPAKTTQTAVQKAARSATAKAIERVLPAEPAKANYFLERGFSDLVSVASRSLKENAKAARSSFATAKDELIGDGVTDTIIGHIGAFCVHFAAGSAVALFGTALTLCLTALHALVVAAVWAPLGAALGITRALEALHLRKHHVEGICPTCKTPHIVPCYRCPVCNAVHYRLRPNCYGITHHTCTCGQKLPCTWFSTATEPVAGTSFKRADLKAVCTGPSGPHPLDASNARIVCIPVTGGRSAGKTAFINAVSHALIEELAPARGLAATCTPGEATTRHAVMMTDYATGEVSMTVESTNTLHPSARPFSFRLSGSGLEQPRLVHLFDIAGETFTANAEHERQLHYGFANGIVLVIDPLSIPQVSDRHRHRLGMKDSAGMATDNPNQVLASLMAKIADAAGTPPNEPLAVPLAVVIGKIDQAGLSRRFDSDAANALIARDPSVTPATAHDALCRAFLKEHGMGNFLNTVDVRFTRARYFACSAIGHTRGAGAYAPRGTMEPIAWILSESDPELATSFGW